MSKDEMYVHISYIEDSIKFVRSAVDRDDFETAMKHLSDIDLDSDELFGLLDDAKEEHENESN